MYSISNQDNPVVQQMIQDEKETYIANCLIRIIMAENLNDDECERVLAIVRERV